MLLAGVAFFPAACRPAHNAFPYPEIEVGLIAPSPPEPGVVTREYPGWQDSAKLTSVALPTRSYQVHRAFRTDGRAGFFAVGYQLLGDQQAELRQYVADHPGDQIAVIVRGDLVLGARIHEDHPSIGLIEGVTDDAIPDLIRLLTND